MTLGAPLLATAVLGRELVAIDTGLRLEGIGLRLLHAPGHHRGLGVETMTAGATPDVTHIAGQIALGPGVTIAAALRGQNLSTDLREVVTHTACRLGLQALWRMARVAVLAVALEAPAVGHHPLRAEGVVLVTGAASNPIVLLAMDGMQRALATNPCSVLDLRRPIPRAHVAAPIPNRRHRCLGLPRCDLRGGRVGAASTTRRGRANDECGKNETEQ
jgi:hypothetical protein